MFNADSNIIFGDRMSGRSLLILDIAKSIAQLGYKVCYLNCVDDERFRNREELELFAYYRKISSTDENNYLSCKVIEEVLNRDTKFNFLIIDDLDILSDRCIKILTDLRITKIFTCLDSNVDKFPKDSQKFEIERGIYDKRLIPTTLINNNNQIMVEDILKSIVREQKINTIINDKGR